MKCFFQVRVTANVILSKLDDDNKETFSLYYGQGFAKSDNGSKQIDEDSYRGANNSELNTNKEENSIDAEIFDRMRVRNVEELRRSFPEKIDPGRIFDTFSHQINDDSEVSVHSIVNLVALFSCVVPEKGLAPNLPLGIPRIETLQND